MAKIQVINHLIFEYNAAVWFNSSVSISDSEKTDKTLFKIMHSTKRVIHAASAVFKAISQDFNKFTVAERNAYCTLRRQLKKSMLQVTKNNCQLMTKINPTAIAGTTIYL
jgi:hypothetical protein